MSFREFLMGCEKQAKTLPWQLWRGLHLEVAQTYLALVNHRDAWWAFKDTPALWEGLCTPRLRLLSVENCHADRYLDTPNEVVLRVDIRPPGQDVLPTVELQAHYEDFATVTHCFAYPSPEELGATTIFGLLEKHTASVVRGLVLQLGLTELWPDAQTLLGVGTARAFILVTRREGNEIVADTLAIEFDPPADANPQLPVCGAAYLATKFWPIWTRAQTSYDFSTGIATLMMTGSYPIAKRVFDATLIRKRRGELFVHATYSAQMCARAPVALEPRGLGPRRKQSARRGERQTIAIGDLPEFIVPRPLLHDVPVAFEALSLDATSDDDIVALTAHLWAESPPDPSRGPEVGEDAELVAATLTAALDPRTDTMEAELEGLYALATKPNLSRVAVRGLATSALIECSLHLSRVDVDSPLLSEPLRFETFGQALAAIPKYDEPELLVDIEDNHFIRVMLEAQHSPEGRAVDRMEGVTGSDNEGGTNG